MPPFPRSAVLALILVASGCGVLAPSLVSIPRLAPDLVPERGGSAVVVTSRSATGGMSGRAVDRDTGEPIIGLRIHSGEAEAVTDLDGAFVLPAAGARLAGDYPGYLSFDASLGDSAAPSPSAVLIMLVRDPEAVEVTVGAAR